MTISSNSFIGMMPPTSGISKDIVSQKDTNSDSSLSIDELGISENQFSTLDSNGDSLVTQDEIATAIDNKLSSYDGTMPSKDEFASLLSDLGLQMPEPPQKQASKESEDFASMIMSNYDSNSDSSLSSDELSLLSSDEFSALDSNGDGSISTDELTSAVEQVASNQGTPLSAPPAGGGGQTASTSSTEEYDELDTNKDGIVSQEEKNAALGISSSTSSTTTSTSTSNQDVKDSLKLLLDTIKLNAQNDSENIDLSSFKNIMKMMNNQNNSSDLNTYVSNLSSSNSSSKFSYA